jgi:protein subunit release factor B
MREATSALRGLRPLTVVLLGGNRVGLGSGKEGSIRLKRSDSFGSRSGYSTSALQKEAIMEMDENDGHRPGA